MTSQEGATDHLEDVHHGEAAGQRGPTCSRRAAAHTKTHRALAVAFRGKICQEPTAQLHEPS